MNSVKAFVDVLKCAYGFHEEPSDISEYEMSPEAKKDWQSDESVNFMEQLASMLHPLSEEKREAFREGYRSGMQDPDSNKELLEECDTSLKDMTEEMQVFLNVSLKIHFPDAREAQAKALLLLEKLKAERG